MYLPCTLGLFVEWQGETEGGAFSFAALEPDVAVMTFDDLARDVEADAEAGVGVDFGVAGAVEALEEVLVVGTVDADAEILYADDDAALFAGDTDIHLIGMGRVPDSVDEQVGQYLAQTVSIPIDRSVGLPFSFEDQAM